MVASSVCLRVVLCIGAATFAGSAGAAVFKCGMNGKVVYQAVPCAGGKAIDASPATGRGDDSRWNSDAARARRDIDEVQRIERERARNRDVSAAERRYNEAINRIDKIHCPTLTNEIERYEAHLREGVSGRMARWYRAEKRAAVNRFDRECR